MATAMAQEKTPQEKPSVEVAVVFEGTPPSSLVTQTLNIVEEETHRVHAAELEAIFQDIDLSSEQKAECRRRLEAFEGRSLLFTKAESGSVLLFAAVTALSYWLIQNTIGETIKEAYKESNLHSRLKNILLGRSQKQAEELTGALTKRFLVPVSDPQVIIVVAMRGEGTEIQLVVTVRMTERVQLPPTIEEFYEGA